MSVLGGSQCEHRMGIETRTNPDMVGCQLEIAPPKLSHSPQPSTHRGVESPTLEQLMETVRVLSGTRTRNYNDRTA